MRAELVILAIMAAAALAAYALQPASGRRDGWARTAAAWRARPAREALRLGGWAAAYAIMVWAVVAAPAPLNVLLVLGVAAAAVFLLDGRGQ